uniref:Uncharacterized protein n=1 Tax=Arundo donax TaxID=35708 RepID=A0A0A8ZGE8_ARUDO
MHGIWLRQIMLQLHSLTTTKRSEGDASFSRPGSRLTEHAMKARPMLHCCSFVVLLESLCAENMACQPNFATFIFTAVQYSCVIASL